MDAPHDWSPPVGLEKLCLGVQGRVRRTTLLGLRESNPSLPDVWFHYGRQPRYLVSEGEGWPGSTALFKAPQFAQAPEGSQSVPHSAPLP